MTLRYKAGKYNKFKFDIALFRGVNESKRSYFAIDDIKVRTLDATTIHYSYSHIKVTFYSFLNNFEVNLLSGKFYQV